MRGPSPHRGVRWIERTGVKERREHANRPTGDPGTPDDGIYRDLYAAIIGQRLPPGTKLKEESLGDIYRVSRARVRKVLARLSHERVVTHVPNKGAFVAEPSVEEAREVFAARRVIEGYLVRLLAERHDPATARVLRAHLRVERRARRTKRFEEVVRSGGDFHLVLAHAAGRPIIGNFVRELVARSALISAAYEVGVPSSCEHDEHRELAECIERGEVDRAVAVMDAHLSGIETRLDLTPPRNAELDLRDVLAGAAYAQTVYD